LNRRELFKSALALGAVVALPLALKLPAPTAKPPVDEYGEFLRRVEQRVTAIVVREGRGLRHKKGELPLWIDPPRADGARYVRKVHLMLEPGPSLLDKLHFEFEEISGSRMVW
jgi:hypothetical protein